MSLKFEKHHWNLAEVVQPSDGNRWEDGIYDVTEAAREHIEDDSRHTEGGNSETATALETPREITIGDHTETFDGTEDIEYTMEDIGAYRVHRTVIPNGADLDNYTANGFYHQHVNVQTNNITNRPPDSGNLAFSLQVIRNNANGVGAHQIYRQHNSNRMWTRFLYQPALGWQPWAEIATEGSPIGDRPVFVVTNWNFDPITTPQIMSLRIGETIRVRGGTNTLNAATDNSHTAIISRVSSGNHWHVLYFRAHTNVNQTQRLWHRANVNGEWTPWMTVIDSAGGIMTGNITRELLTGGSDWTSGTINTTGDTRALMRQRARGSSTTSQFSPITSSAIMDGNTNQGIWSTGVHLSSLTHNSWRVRMYLPTRNANGTDADFIMSSGGVAQTNLGRLADTTFSGVASSAGNRRFANMRIQTGRVTIAANATTSPTVTFPSAFTTAPNMHFTQMGGQNLNNALRGGTITGASFTFVATPAFTAATAVDWLAIGATGDP